MEEMERYIRQISLKKFGEQGQAKLRQGSVLVVGAGGLGSPAALYLAAAGIGRLGIIDQDTVDLANLHRQLLHTEASIGEKKVFSAKKTLQEHNPKVKVEAYPFALTALDIDSLLQQYDFTIDATDDSETKFLINDRSVALDKPFVYAGAVGWQGQLMSYVPGRGPCCRCLFGSIDITSLPRAADVGVFPPLVGVIGAMQAGEAIKYLLGQIDHLLLGKLLTYDALTMQVRTLSFERRADCAACGTV